MEQERKYCTILKTNINVTDMKSTIEYLSENLEELRGEYICVSNVHTTVMAYRDEAYRNVQNSAAMASGKKNRTEVETSPTVAVPI